MTSRLLEMPAAEKQLAEKTPSGKQVGCACCFTGKSRDFSAIAGFLLLLFLLLPLFAAAETVELQIFHTSDIHANLSDCSGDNRPMAVLAGTLNELRRKYGRDTTLYIDTGDTVQGSVEGTLSRGMAPLEILRLMECDVWVPGNHEFDFGGYRFLELAESMRTILICSNLKIGLDKIPAYPAFRIFERGGIRVAVVGASASYMEHWFLKEVTEVVTADSALKSLRRIMPEVRAQRPDVIILAIHQGWMGKNDVRGVNEVDAIAAEFPEIDLILGGHTHRAFPGRRLAHGVWYVQPPAHGAFIAHATLECDTDSGNVKAIRSRLVPVEADGPVDAKVAAVSAIWQKRALEYSETAVAAPPDTDILSRGRAGNGNPVSEVMCAAIADASGADVVLHGTLSKAGFPAGKTITRGDLFKVVPYENTIVTCEMTPSQLKDVIAEQWTLRKSYSYCGLYGIHAAVDGGGKVRLLDFPSGKERLLVAVNSHTAAGSGRTPILRRILAEADSRTGNTGISTRDALEKYLRKQEKLSVKPEVWLRAED